MKILWVVNAVFPEPSKDLDMGSPPSGGWMFGLAKDIVENGHDLVVTTVLFKSKEYHKTIKGIEYYILGGKTQITEYDTSLEKKWKKVIEETKPDIVHIHGMEFAHGLSLIKTFPNLNFTVSIQGILGECFRYYTGGIPINQIRKYKTFRDFIKNDGVLEQKEKYRKRAEKVEKKYFKLVDNIMGRSEWDLTHTKIQNPNAKYYHCNESLRDSFYTSKKWDITKKEPHTIFLSQGTYPLKGFHKVLEAVNLIKDDFPDLKIRIAGVNILKDSSFKDRLKRRGYAKYLSSLISKFDLHRHVEFTGILNEEGMVKEFLNCNVFICPSSIENCSNSVGEAQLLGVPCIASYVGGIPDMIVHSESGLLYRFEAVEMLSQRITEIFQNEELTHKLSQGGIRSAIRRHDRASNLKTTLAIYQQIVSEKS